MENLDQIINIELAIFAALGCIALIVGLIVMIKETWFKKTKK